MIPWTLILATSLARGVGSAQRTAHPDQQVVDGKTLGLQLTIAISGEKFCSGDADVYTDVLNLATLYANQGKTPLRIFLGTDFAPRVLVARSEEDLRASNFESGQNGDYYPMDGADTCWVQTRKMSGLSLSHRGNPSRERAEHRSS
jgi:hypothetical protein